MSVFLAAGFGVGYQAFGTGGLPLNLGKLYTYLANSTTPQETYTTSAGNVQNANPIILGVDGRTPYEVWLSTGVAYKFALYDANDNLISTFDGVYGINDLNAGSAYALLAGNNTFTGANRGAYGTLASTSASVAVNLGSKNNFKLTMTEDTTLAAPSNVVAGQSGAIEVTQDSGTPWTLAYDSFWKWAGGTPGVISATLSSVNVICYLTDSSGTFATCTMNAAVA